MPTNMHTILESSTEPGQVAMIFPKDAMPKLNMALPGNLHQTYTKERLHKPLLDLIPSNKKELQQELFPKPKSNHVKSPKERESNIPLKPIYPPSYFEDSPRNKVTAIPKLGTETSFETTTPTLVKDKENEVHLFIPGGVPIEFMPNTVSVISPTRPSKETVFRNVQSTENKLFVPGGVPRDLLESIRNFSKTNTQEVPVFNANTPLGEVFGHFPSNNVVPIYKASSTTPVTPLEATDNVFHKTYQFNLKMLKSTIEKVENDVKVLKDSFIKSLNKTSNPIDRVNEKIQSGLQIKSTITNSSQENFQESENKLNSSSYSLNASEDSINKINNFKGLKSESLTRDNIAPVDQLDLLQETLDPALATRSISNSPQNLLDSSKFNLQAMMMKNSEFKPINSNPVYKMSANALANAQTINSIMSDSTNDSVLKSISNPDLNKTGFNTNSNQNQYKTLPLSETPQQLPSEIDVESWTKNTPSEVTYTPVQNIEAHNQKHTETQYTIQQQNIYQESSTIRSLGNSFVNDNLKNSINTITEPKQIDRKTTPTIYLVTPAPMMTTTEMPTTTAPSTTTSTTTSTTPSTTTTTSTTESTTTTTTPLPTTTPTTTTTTTPIPIIEEITTTPKPSIVFQPPSTTSGTIVNSQGPPQTNTALIGANSELEKNIKLLEQLLQLQASLKPKTSSSSTTTTTTTSSTPSTTTTTKATEAPTKKVSASNADDEQFINQLRQLLLIQQQATKKPTTSSTTTTSTTTTTTTTTPKPTTTTTTTTTRKPITISPQNLQDLLNSFSTPSFTTTTSRPIINNADDLEFLNSLREIGKLQITTSAPTTFANRIIELALKNRPSVKPTSPVYISTTVPPFVPMPKVKIPQILPSNEIDKHRQDEASLSADLSLLSTLLGRRITVADLPQITQQFGGNRGKPAPATRRTTTTTTTPRTTRTTTTSTTEKPMTRDEIAEIEKNLNLLSSLLGRPVSLNELPLIMQELRSGRKPKGTASGATINFITPAPFKTTTTTLNPRPTVSLQSQTPISQEEVIELLKDPALGSPEQLNIYGQTNDAILAAVLKQRGIGPTHNNLPVNNLFGQEQTQRPYRPIRPPPPPPPPQRRPVLDGLAWLWRTWQETAGPGNRVSKNNRQPTASASTRLESPLIVGAFGGDAPTPTVNSNEGGEYADLQYPQNPSLGQGNGLLTAAFGVTRAVSQFLGAAFQGAAKSVQSAFSPQAIQQPSLISLSG